MRARCFPILGRSLVPLLALGNKLRSDSTPRLGLGLVLIAALAACGPAAEGTAGEETSPCNDGLCLGDLECRSDLCVDPDWDPGSSGANVSGSSVDPSGASGSAGSGTSSDTSGDPKETGSATMTGSDPSTTSDASTSGASTSGDPTWGTSSGGFTSGPTGDCGDGVVSPGEQCDGPELQGLDCSALGLGTGSLSCDPVTCTFDTSMCNTGSGGTSG